MVAQEVGEEVGENGGRDGGDIPEATTLSSRCDRWNLVREKVFEKEKRDQATLFPKRSDSVA